MSERESTQILALGASITAGYYNNGRKFHPYSIRLSSLLSNLKNCENQSFHVEPFGLSGEKTGEMKLRLEEIFNYYSPSSFGGVIIIGGTNDLISHPSSVIIKNLIDMYERCLLEKHFKFVVACSIPSSLMDGKFQENSFEGYLKKKSEVNQAIEEFVVKLENPKLIFVDLMEELNYCKCTEEERVKYWDDTLHFTPEGYDRIADILFDKLQKSNLLI